MVSFIADPNIALSQEQRRLALAKMLQGYTPPQNPYGYTTAGLFEPLAHALSARWAGQDANRLQTQQQAAQGEVLGNLLGLQTGTPGAQQYGVNRVAVGGFPGATVESPTRLTIDDTGAVTPVDAQLLKRAGLSAGEYALAHQKAGLAGREASEANRIAYAAEQLGKATTDAQRQYWYGQADPLKAAEREFSAGFTGVWAEDKFQDNMIVPVSNADLYSPEGQERYTRVNVEKFAPDTYTEFQLKDHKEYSAEAVRLGIRLVENEQILEMFKNGTLQTGSLQPLLIRAKGILEDLGVPVEGLTPAQIFQATSNKRAMQMRNPKSGFGLTGNTSDKDLIFLQNAVMHLSKTEAANEALLIMEIARDRRLKDIAEVRMDFIEKNPGKVLSHDVVNDYVQSTPLLSDEEKDRLNVLMENNPIGGDGLTEGGQGSLPTTTYIEPWSSD